MKITTPQGSLDCLSAGPAGADRPAIVLVHGIQGTASIWQPLMAGLAPHCRVVAPNLRGRAGSWSPDAPAAYGLAGFAGDLRSVLCALPAPVLLVGWSMGCLVALEYLRRHGQQGLCGLMLASGSPCLGATGGADARWFRGDTMPELIRDATDRARRLRLRETATPAAVAGSWLAAQAADYRDLLPDIRLPTLILHGADDPECPLGHARIMARAIPGAELRVWPGCGHVPMAHDPAGFLDELLAFADRCPPACD